MKKKSPPDDPGISASLWTARAIWSVASTPPQKLLTNHTPAKAVRPMARRPDVLEEPPGHGRNSHPVPEICIALSGHPVLTLGRQVYAFTAPHVAILGPGVLHSEARIATTRDYALLWIMPSRSSVHLATSRYKRTHGWDMPWRHTFHNETVATMRRTLDAFLQGQPGAAAGFHAELLAVLAAAHRDLVIDRSPHRAGGQKLALLRHVKNYLDSNLHHPVSLKDAARMIRLSPNYLNTLFHQWQGRGIHAYLIERRMEKALHLCRKSSLNVKEIAAATGFNDPLYFSRAFLTYHGLRPSRVPRENPDAPQHAGS